jgi:glycosyltransferase involved in cell wall biosynthesis
LNGEAGRVRILLLSDRIPPENRGGAGRVTWLLAGSLRDAGHEVHAIAATPGAAFEDVRDGIPTYHVHSRYPERFLAYLSLYNPQTIPHLSRLYAQIRPDVVNAHNVHADLSYASLTLAHRMGIPAVFNSHDVMPFAYAKLTHFVKPVGGGVDSPDEYRLPRFYNLKQMRFRYNPLRNIIIRHILRQHARIRVAVSDAHRQSLEANGLPPFRVVHNGLDAAAFTASPDTVERLRARLELEGRLVILFAGRLSREKGSAQLLRALKQVVESVPEALLLILSNRKVNWGDTRSPEFDRLRAEHVRSAGWLDGDELAAAYHLADVVTMPSIIMDTFGMVNLEAMAAGKPVIATCFGGSPEVVADGETGYVVNPFDTETFAERLRCLLTDSALRQRLGMAGQRRLREHFTLARQTEQMINIYNEAIANTVKIG